MNMMRKNAVWMMLWMCCSVAMMAQRVSSPSGKVWADVSINDGRPQMQVRYKDAAGVHDLQLVGLGIDTRSRQMSRGLTLSEATKAMKGVDNYRMVTGKQLSVSHKYACRNFVFSNVEGGEMTVEVRAYNDGIAFRYLIGGTDAVVGEATSYSFADGVNRWIQPQKTDYEDFYPQTTTVAAGKYSYPALFEPTNGVFTLITEAGIGRQHSASYLKAEAGYKVEYIDSEVPFTNSWASAWRVMIVGNASDIVASTLVTDVSPESELTDTSWIEPAAASWVYWAYNHGSKDFPTVKQYIDLAAEMKWPYCLIDWEWEFMENGGDVEDAIRYADSKNVKILLWYNSITSWAGPGAPGLTRPLNTHEDREREFSWLNKVGVAGIKVDFFLPDGRDMINYYIDILTDAASHNLMVDFHGCTIPRGWQRTYPNMISMEAVYGAEWYNNRPTMTRAAASHNTVLPFTRNVVGPMDYTPGTFSDSQHPHITTYGHEMALPILFESGIQHMPDRPSAYRELPADARRLFSNLPTAWDETRLLQGYPGKYVVIARRKGTTWFIAGINGTEQTMNISLNLKKAKIKGQKVTIVSDGNEDRQLKTLTQPYSSVSKAMTISMRPRGGFALMVE